VSDRDPKERGKLAPLLAPALERVPDKCPSDLVTWHLGQIRDLEVEFHRCRKEALLAPVVTDHHRGMDVGGGADCPDRRPVIALLAEDIAGSFENSIAWQKRTWGWVPDGKVNVLLKDFGDYGNAGARSTPNNALIVDIAPFSFAFETFVASERAAASHESASIMIAASLN